MRSSVLVASLLVAVTASSASAEETLASLAELKAACREAREPGRRELYVVEVPSFRFSAAGEGLLLVDTRRNLSAFGGSAALFPADLEPIGFRAGPERQRALEEARRAGARLRIGFFLGFDGEGQPCVLRPAVGVSTIRMDVAFLELVDRRGRVLARDDTERLRAWQDDEERDGIPGDGPRAAVDPPWSSSGAVPASAVSALRALAPRLARCHAAHVQRGGAGEGRVLLQLPLENGRPVEPSIAFSTLHDEAMEACLLEVVRAVSLPDVVAARLTLPVRFAAD